MGFLFNSEPSLATTSAVAPLRLNGKSPASCLRLAINNAQQCAHSTVEAATPLLIGFHRPRRYAKQTFKFFCGRCNFQADGFYLGRGDCISRNLMCLQPNFTAQMLGHLFESRDKSSPTREPFKYDPPRCLVIFWLFRRNSVGRLRRYSDALLLRIDYYL